MEREPSDNALINPTAQKNECAVHILEENGWTCQTVPHGRVWFKGFLFRGTGFLLGSRAATDLGNAFRDVSSLEVVRKQAKDLDGHFAFVLQRGAVVVALVDRIRSTPLFLGCGPKGWALDACAGRLQQRLGLKEPNHDAGLALAMSGYTIGRDTLFKGLIKLLPGECALMEAGRDPQIRRYYVYAPWAAEPSFSGETGLEELEAATRKIQKRFITSLQGRQVLLPISGGLDSRLIASMLRDAGYDHVFCYSYGLPGNWEARAGRHIAEKCQFPWTFIPYSRRMIRSRSKGAEFRRYLRFADTLSSVPFVQDFFAVQTIRDRKMAEKDAVFVNGNSGDFISGGHIPGDISGCFPETDPEHQVECTINLFIRKHFSLWQGLLKPANVSRIRGALSKLYLDCVPSPLDARCLHGAYECLEWQLRQCAFVVTGQRVYEFFGFDWRLPLWDQPYLDFWKEVPVGLKLDQQLYRQWLRHANWGDLWRNFSPRRYTAPQWTRVLRPLLRLLLKPWGNEAFRALERRAFLYFTDILCTHATVGTPYRKMLWDRRGFRNSLSFRVEDYLLSKGRKFENRSV